MQTLVVLRVFGFCDSAVCRLEQVLLDLTNKMHYQFSIDCAFKKHISIDNLQETYC